MNRSFARLAKQISVATGKAYDGPFADELAKHNFSSAYWINSEVLKRTSVKVKPDQVDQGISLSNSLLYNASQTTDPSKIESLCGKLVPKSAITGKALRIGSEFPTEIKGENAWITESQVRALDLSLMPKASPVTLTIDNKSTKLYQVDDIEQAAKLKKFFAVRHSSLASGIPYKGSSLLHLIKISMKNGFTSGIWFTKSRMDKIGATLKPNQQPVKLEGDKGVEIYNADQLEDKSTVEKRFQEMMAHHIVGISGKNFPKRISEQLQKICEENPTFSRYWLSKSQAQQEGGLLTGEKPFPVEDDKGISNFYNAAQMKGSVMEKCIRAHRSYIKAQIEA